MRLSTALALLLQALPPLPAMADLSFVEVLQGQTSHGKDGLFGKTWVELSGKRMRLVSGYARRLVPGGPTREPQRVVQVIDLERKERLLIAPETRTFRRMSLAEVDYLKGLDADLERGPADKLLLLDHATFERIEGKRVLMGVECSHYRLRAHLALSGKDGRLEPARMDQDVWVAPVSGKLSNTLLDLLSFENAYRAAAGGTLTPLDYERYQLREAAAYLQTTPSQLRLIVETLRDKFREIASYPVASSVSWWRPEAGAGESRTGEEPAKAKQDRREPARLGSEEALPWRSRRLPRGRRPWRKPKFDQRRRFFFMVMDLRHEEEDVDKLHEEIRWVFGGPPIKKLDGPRSLEKRGEAEEARERPVYPVFRNDFQQAIDLLQSLQTSDPRKGAQPLPKKEEPFYQIYAELHGIEMAATVPQSDFDVPEGFAEDVRPSEEKGLQTGRKPGR